VRSGLLPPPLSQDSGKRSSETVRGGVSVQQGNPDAERSGCEGREHWSGNLYAFPAFVVTVGIEFAVVEWHAISFAVCCWHGTSERLHHGLWLQSRTHTTERLAVKSVLDAASEVSASLEEAWSEIVREIGVRERCFEKWVQEGKLAWADGRDRLARLHAAGIALKVILDDASAQGIVEKGMRDARTAAAAAAATAAA
jgi:hypothetical protein